MQEVAEPFRLLPPPTWVGKDTLSPASKVMPNPQWVSPHKWTISGSLTGGSPIQAATPGTPCSCSQSSTPVACRSRGLTVFVSLLNNSSCFQPVLNPPGNLILQRRRVLLYVISRQQLWPRHPERRSLCRTVVAGVNFPSPPRHSFKGCWKCAVTLCAHTASSDFFLAAVGYLSLHPHCRLPSESAQPSILLFFILPFKGLNFPPANRRSACFLHSVLEAMAVLLKSDFVHF